MTAVDELAVTIRPERPAPIPAPPHTPTQTLNHPRWPGLAHVPRPGLKAAVARQLVRRAVADLPLRIVLPDGSWLGRGGPDEPRMLVHRPAEFFARIGADAKIGFGEGYMVGAWDCAPHTDLADLITPLAREVGRLVPAPLQKLRGLAERRQPFIERATPAHAQENVRRHYDLPDALFAAFLDETLSYSCAWFDHPDEDLSVAQRRKIDAVLDDAGVTTGSEVLEIGTGWGELAIRAAGRGARVTSLTLSVQQRAVAQQRIAAAGLSDRATVLLQDYRSATGRYDAIVSVEMLEAVGFDYWPEFFAALDRLLRPDGRVGLQTITMPHDRMLATRNAYTWIHKYVFPGGILPSVEAIEHNLRRHTDLRMAGRRELGPHYATTLRRWRTSFRQNWPTLAQAGFDPTFKRMWEFYLAYSEAGFQAKYLGLHQFSLVHSTRPTKGG